MVGKNTEELNETELDQITGGVNRRAHDHLTDHNWQLEIEGATTGAAKASGDVVIKGKKILQN